MVFKISVVMAAYNSEDYISSAIESIINQSLDFKRNIQIVIIDDASLDNTSLIAKHYQEKYPDNILFLRNDKNYGPAYCRNRGLGHINSEFVNFLDSDDYITEYAFSQALDLFKKHDEIDIVSMPIYYFGARKGEHTLNYKYDKTQVVNLEEKPEYIQLSGASSFFRVSKLNKYKFEESLKVSEDPLLINQLLLDNPNIGFLDGCAYYYRKHDHEKSLIGASSNRKSYYTTRVDNYFLKLIEYSLKKYDKVPKFIQHVLMYDLQWIFEIRSITHLLDSEEVFELYAKLIEILSFIDSDVVIFQKSIPGHLKAHILLLKKYGVEYLTEKKDSSKDECTHIEELDFDKINIDICQIQNDEIYVLGYLTNFTADSKIEIVINDDNVIPVNKMEFPQRDNYSLNFNYGFNHHFEASIPIDDGMKISFKVNDKNLIPVYSHTSRLSEISGYMLSDKHLVIDRGDHISVLNRTFTNTLKNEVKTLKNMLLKREEGWRTGVLLRLLYFIYYPYYIDKKIWIFMDLPYSADDNAFQLFKYLVELNDGEINKYFAISKHDYDVNDVEIMANKYRSSSRLFKIRRLLGLGTPSSEYQKVSDIGFDIPFRSMRHRLLSLFAEAIISSHPDNNVIYPFWGNFPYLAGLIKSKTIFLQHGVTKDDTSSWLNKYDKNIDFILTVSDFEKESFIENNYGYSEDSIHVLGFPRFDKLEKLEENNEIVIMPTWRRHFDNLEDAVFAKTKFFNAFNSLLNDKELIEFLGSEGYSLVFKPHPNLNKFIHLFDRNDEVLFIDDSYSEIFNHSSILITDYSSVAFDFAYLEKPVIYYQYSKDYHFDVDSAYFKYDNMGFGPIAETHEEIKNEIIALVLNDCEMDDIYKKRVNEFFKFRDNENSKRVFEAIKEMDFSH
ncbi:CDP-glycerol glycerophosphotransferase family protein [Methanobrevibacter sp.]|uniref:bifunctional glycosyltransferase/CDP-glycerol:glycerophosphate glycerophosphotransferase n=1 Tax=Methanobrevibacter sp. TaxID=66852 RepID=UPI0025ED0AA3|nr:CDP-glycerol glycerophosphotransferase family protein [Methanobrevibacter sp.]MBQ6511118.1 CDP-glycerol glycerophosphotransferase family protein [Methanobrevibacter sp.]